MKLRIVTAVLLLTVIAGAIWCAGFLHGQYTEARTQYETHAQQLKELDDQAAQLQQTLDALTTQDADLRQEQARQLAQEAEDMLAQLDTMRAEIETMKTLLEENQDAIAEAEAELTYLQGVYDELEKGLAEVEGYLAGN